MKSSGLCMRCYQAQWRKANPEKTKARRERYTAKHPEKQRERDKKRRAAGHLVTVPAMLPFDGVQSRPVE